MPNTQPWPPGLDFGICSPRVVGKLLNISPYFVLMGHTVEAWPSTVPRDTLQVLCRARSQNSPCGVRGGEITTLSPGFFSENFGFPPLVSFHECPIHPFSYRRLSKILAVFSTFKYFHTQTWPKNGRHFNNDFRALKGTWNLFLNKTWYSNIRYRMDPPDIPAVTKQFPILPSSYYSIHWYF